MVNIFNPDEEEKQTGAQPPRAKRNRENGNANLSVSTGSDPTVAQAQSGTTPVTTEPATGAGQSVNGKEDTTGDGVGFGDPGSTEVFGEDNDDNKAFEAYLASAPEEIQSIEDPDYIPAARSTGHRIRRFWELMGKPKNFNDEGSIDYYSKSDDGKYKIPAAKRNPDTGEEEFMVYPEHNQAIAYERWYNEGAEDAAYYRKNYDLDKSGSVWKYVPKESGAPSSSAAGSTGGKGNTFTQDQLTGGTSTPGTNTGVTAATPAATKTAETPTSTKGNTGTGIYIDGEELTAEELDLLSPDMKLALIPEISNPKPVQKTHDQIMADMKPYLREEIKKEEQQRRMGNAYALSGLQGLTSGIAALANVVNTGKGGVAFEVPETKAPTSIKDWLEQQRKIKTDNATILKNAQTQAAADFKTAQQQYLATDRTNAQARLYNAKAWNAAQTLDFKQRFDMKKLETKHEQDMKKLEKNKEVQEWLAKWRTDHQKSGGSSGKSGGSGRKNPTYSELYGEWSNIPEDQRTRIRGGKAPSSNQMVADIIEHKKRNPKKQTTQTPQKPKKKDSRPVAGSWNKHK